MSKYGKLLAKQEAQKQKEAEEHCEKYGHIMLPTLGKWNYPAAANADEEYEIDVCVNCGFGRPIYA